MKNPAWIAATLLTVELGCVMLFSGFIQANGRKNNDKKVEKEMSNESRL